jgi:hypothetical protein
MKHQELVVWRPLSEEPDQDETVLVTLDDDRQRWCWVAVWDGQQYRDACGMKAYRQGLVRCWAPMLRGPL